MAGHNSHIFNAVDTDSFFDTTDCRIMINTARNPNFHQTQISRIANVDPSKPILLHPGIHELLDPWERSLQELNTMVRSPTVGANCRGIVMADVLSVRT